MPGAALRSHILVVAALALLALAGGARAQGYAMPCHDGHEGFAGAAEANARSIDTLQWAPFGAPETGWEVYAPLTAREIGTACDAYTPAFAAALAAWQRTWGLAPTGVFGPETFQILKGLSQERRPFIRARLRDECPEPPGGHELAAILVEEELARRDGRLLRREVLEAYRRMVSDARAALPKVAQDPELLSIFSGFREPSADAARCAAEQNCDGVRRAACSPHRTGNAVDIFVGVLPGHTVDSVHVENRLHQSRGEAYRWLVANAARYGFVNYVYEPWHWEWIGVEAAQQGAGR